MTGRHVPPSETGADGPYPDWDDLLAGRRLPETEDDMRVADAVAALQAPGTVDELRDADTAVAALLAAMAAVPERESVVVPMAPRRRARTAVIAGSVVAATLVLTGTAAAAATGSLPAPLQRIAQSLVGAPAPASDDQGSDSATPPGGSVGPSTRSASPHASPAPSHRPSTPVGPGAPAPGSHAGRGWHVRRPPPGLAHPARSDRASLDTTWSDRAPDRPPGADPPPVAGARAEQPSDLAAVALRPRRQPALMTRHTRSRDLGVIRLAVPCSGLLRTGDRSGEPV